MKNFLIDYEFEGNDYFVFIEALTEEAARHIFESQVDEFGSPAKIVLITEVEPGEYQ